MMKAYNGVEWHFFAKHSTYVDAHIYAHTLTPMNARTPYPYEYLRETESKKLNSAGFEIDEVITNE
jgi:hypothetical protein